ncbi:MAG: trans-sulfuration enzyme family protein [Terriglobales bacterium]
MMNVRTNGSWSRATLAARTYLDREKQNRPLSTTISRGTIYTAPSAQEHARLYRDHARTFYQRFGHLNEDELAEKIAALEAAEAGLVFASGMAAISTSLLAHLPPRSHVIAGDQIFAQTEEILRWLQNGRGVEVSFVDTRDPDRVRVAFRPETRLVYVETPSNPTLRVSDIAAISLLARERGALVFVDSTFATPMCQRPLGLGASLVLHSATKLLGGHMDVMGGAALGHADVLKPIAEMKRLLGGVLDPQASWLVLRGIKTLHVRSERVCASALAIAELLQASSAVASVAYPLLPSHPDFEVAARQMSAGGGVVSFSLKGGAPAARRLLDSLNLIQIASSLGGVETTVEMPYDLDWIGRDDLPAAADRALIRLSVGLEDIRELRAELSEALNAV